MSRIKSLLKREDWLRHVSAWRTSGLTQAAYCREHQLNATTFNGWVLRKQTAPSTTATAPLTTVPVVIQSGTPVATSIASSIVLQHSSGWQLAFSSDVQIHWLARLLKELA
jgi:hypothetical protein